MASCSSAALDAPVAAYSDGVTQGSGINQPERLTPSILSITAPFGSCRPSLHRIAQEKYRFEYTRACGQTTERSVKWRKSGRNIWAGPRWRAEMYICAGSRRPENASRYERGIWDAISAESSIKEKDPFAEVLVNSRWRGRESRPRAARTDRCGAYAPCELRWQTLTRLLSPAPSRGSIPCGGCIKEKDPFTEVLVNLRWRGRESNP